MATNITPHLTAAEVEGYRQRGFIRVPNIISKEEAARFHRAAVETTARLQDRNTQTEKKVFSQHVNVWLQDEEMKALTLHPHLAAVATQLAGVPLRLWHDHTLIKPPRNQAPTHYHQDGPFWPHDQRPGVSLSAWVALVDVPVERGCMTFIPGRHTISDLRPQNLRDEHDLMGLAPEMQWQERVTIPLRAGDCTFHHQFTPHMANANITDDPRVAHIVIFMAADTRYTGKGHPVTDPIAPEVGAVLDQEIFPLV